MTISRRDVLFTALGASAALTLPSLARAEERSTSRLAFDTTRVTMTLPSIDVAHHGLRVAQLSDLHLGETLTPGERVRRALDAIEAAEVELLVLTGDFLTHDRKPLSDFRDLLGRRAPTPVVAVLGNHDHEVDARACRTELESLDITVLQNENTAVTLRGEPFRIIGIDDGASRHDDVSASMRGAEGRSRLVLTHSPPTVDRLPKDGGLLCLSGHTHGGAVVVGEFTRVAFKLGGQRYMRGPYAVGGNHLYVNRGLGMGHSLLYPRHGAPPELTLFTLESREVAS